MNNPGSSSNHLLRARVEAAAPSPSVILVTSSQRRDGKSVTAFGLAHDLALAGYRTAIVDANPSAPELPSSNDIVRLATLRQHDFESGDGMTYGSCSAFSIATELNEDVASRETIGTFVRGLRRNFEYVVIDGARCTESNMTSILAQVADSTIVTVRVDRQIRREDKVMMQTLEALRANVLGVVTTSVDSIAAFAARTHPNVAKRPVAESDRRVLAYVANR